MVKKNYKKVNLTSSNLSEDKKRELKKIMPEVFTEGRIKWDKLKKALGEKIDEREKFGFTWAGKSEAIRNVLTPSKATLKPNKKDSIKFDESENIFIEGDNLEALKLLQKAYFEKVKLLYIDPPYNTGGDFVYKDNFHSPLTNYLEQTGQVDESGNKLQTNSETSGRFHSDWLSMMYPRLKLGWNLLREDGVICVSIGDEEVHHLRIIMDEIFGDENFQGHIHWRRRFNQPNDKTKMIGLVAEHILVYTKNSIAYKENGVGKLGLTGKFSNPDKDPRGDWSSKPWKVGSDQSGSKYQIKTPTGKILDEEWMGDEKTYKKLLEDNRIVFPKNGDGMPRKKYFKFEREEEGQCATNWWTHEQFGHNQEGNNEMTDIFGVKNIFSNPKPTKLIKNLITLSNAKDGDIVMDFFAGSGTLAHSVLNYNKEEESNLQFILVQLPEETDKKSIAHKNGYKNITEITKERIKRVINGYGENPEPIKDGFKLFQLGNSNYKENNFEYDPEKSEAENKNALQEYLSKSKQESLFEKANNIDVVYENIIKEGLSLNSKINEIKIGKNKLFEVTDGERIINLCLDSKIDSSEVKEIIKKYKNKIFICLDSALSDTTKANLGLQVELKTI